MNWIIQILIGLGIVLVFGVSSVESGPRIGDGWVAVNVNGHPGVIVSADYAVNFGTGADGFWMPSETDVENTELAITEEKGDLAHLRQYAGIIEDGEKKVFVNGFCDDTERNWYAEIVAVDDGGDCFFSAVYNVDAGELEYFRFNGNG